MPRRMRSLWALAALFLSSIWGVRAADGPDAADATIECEAAIAGDAADALFREIELRAYRIEGLARDCRSALMNEGTLDAPRHRAGWLDVLDQVQAISETLRSIAAGEQILSAPQRRAWMEIETDSMRIQQQASETVRQLGESTIGVQSEQYVRVLLDTQDRSLRMARIVVALDHCGELRALQETRGFSRATGMEPLSPASFLGVTATAPANSRPRTTTGRIHDE